MRPGDRPGRRNITCEVCGTRMDPDDPLGVVDGRAVHAECALVLWLGSHRRRSAANGDSERALASIDEWLELVEPQP